MKVFLLFLLSGLAVAAYAAAPAKVVRVVDGDTLKVELNGRIENVRLIGIDTPESKANKKAKKDAARSSQDIRTIVSLGKAATSFTKSIVKPGDLVDIEQDVQPRDRYGRLLVYVYLKSGKMLNEEIIAAGFASIMTIPPNVRYQERFLRAYRTAREGQRGLWATP
jgi:micrococcal nuclease